MSKLAKKGILLVVFFGSAVAGHHYLRGSSPLYNFFFSPSYLYLNLAEVDFDLSTFGTNRELQFTTKYPGNHWVSVLVENPAKVMESYASDFEVKISISSEGRIFSESIASDSSFWFYGGPERSGFALKTYKIPSELPIGQPLTAKVTVMKESPGFNKRYGNQRLIISKYSDE